MSTRRKLLAALLLVGAALGTATCGFDSAYRQKEGTVDPTICEVGALRCRGDALEICQTGLDKRVSWTVKDNCALRALTCASASLGCKVCVPDSTTCGGEGLARVDKCKADGSGYLPGSPCATSGTACRSGRCDDLCAQARIRSSNVGCEYWAVQLDNANISAALNASGQQYAVVVSNPQPDVGANVTVEVDDGVGTDPPKLRVVARARVTPQNLEVFLLGPRWVDGTTNLAGDGQTHTAVSRHAFRITSDAPIIAYQFNPLDNASVFSNDASLLKPVEAIGSAPKYVVVGWPQTIARDDDPNKDFGIQLRSFLTIVGTRDATTLTLKSNAAIVAGGPVPATAKGGTLTWKLRPFEVLNLETGSFGADFTGSILDSDQPVVVFTGSEAADAPAWTDVSKRSCCADHLEEQLDPARTAGRRYVVGRSPIRSKYLNAAGALGIGLFLEPEYARIVAATDGKVTVKTTLPPPNDSFVLDSIGAFREIEFKDDFTLESDGAVHIAQIQASQEAAGIPRGFPGGDPSLTIMPPIEQFRTDYVFLTPDKYAFDFITILAPKGASILLDGLDLPKDACEKAFAKPAKSPTTGATVGNGFDIYRCQLSFPVIDLSKPSGKQITPGRQNDGVHRIQANLPVGVVVYGFDDFVSYAYAAGTELQRLSPR